MQQKHNQNKKESKDTESQLLNKKQDTKTEHGGCNPNKQQQGSQDIQLIYRNIEQTKSTT